MKCLKCQKEIPSEIKFCPECGNPCAIPPSEEKNIPAKKPLSKLQSCLGCLGLIVIILFIGSCLFGGNDNQTTKTATSANTVQDTNLTPEQKIEKICKDIAKDNFIEINITNNVTIPDGKTVFLKVKAKDNLTNEMARTGTLWQSRDIIKALYTSGLPIGSCKIVSSSTLVDKYGKESEGVVMRCSLDAKTAEKINWKNADALEWEKVLNEYWAHPSYQK